MNEILKKNGVQFGFIIGFFAILLPIITYASGQPLYKNGYLGASVYVVYWTIRIIQANKTKKDLGNQTVSLKDIFTTLLISTTIGIIISTGFNYVFYNFIATELKIDLNEFMNLKQVEIQQVFNKGKIDKQMIMGTDNFEISILLRGAVFSILFSSIFNLILAAIFKSKTSNQL